MCPVGVLWLRSNLYVYTYANRIMDTELTLSIGSAGDSEREQRFTKSDCQSAEFNLSLCRHLPHREQHSFSFNFLGALWQCNAAEIVA